MESNEQLLVTTYAIDLAVAVLAGLLPWLILRRRFRRLCDEYAPSLRWGTLPRLFMLGLMLPPLIGFTSVSYFSCNHTTYREIVADRQHLLTVSRQHIETATLYALVALLLWCGLIALLVVARDRPKSPQSERPQRDRW